MFHFDYKEAPKNLEATRGDFVRIARYLLPAWKPSALILVCILATSLLGLIPPLLIREVIDRAIPQREGALLNWLIAVMIAAPLVSGLLGVWQNYLVTIMSQGVMFELRDEIYGKMMRQSLRFFTNTKSGDILSRIQNDVGGVQGVVSGTLVSIAANGLTVATTLGRSARREPPSSPGGPRRRPPRPRSGPPRIPSRRPRSAARPGDSRSARGDRDRERRWADRGTRRSDGKGRRPT